jgi:DNA topoisomerase-2
MNYEKLDSISHIHKRPDMYIGSLNIRNQNKEFINEDNLIIEKNNINYSDGLLRIFVEALSNAIDNVWRSRKNSIKCSSIQIQINNETNETTVLNDGIHIPVQIHPKEKIYCPELIFGHLLSSSNYNDEEERLTSGRNGLGIKLLNVFSKKFSIEIVDPELKLKYNQTWYNNMREKEDPIIKSYSKKGYTKISWIPDFEKFGMIRYDDTIIQLYKKYCMDAALITNLPIFFNEEKFYYKNFIDYIKLYKDTKECIVFESVHQEENTEYISKYAIVASDGEYKEIGFINGVYTKDGGSHLDNISNELFKQIMNKFNKDKTNITSKDIKPHFMIFANTWAPNPEFSSQSKTKLLAPSFHDKIDSKIIDKIMKWSFVDKINDLLKTKELLNLKKVEKKKGFKKIEGLDHANLMNTKHSSDCTLILCEGLSAKTFAVKGINIGWNNKKGRDYFGIYALRGKLLNVRNASISSISNNKEITDIILALGLKLNVDYSLEENYKTLNYGKVLILTDADEDGHHICSLIINFFHKMYPSLLQLKEPFLWYMLTPIAKIFHDQKNSTCYYNEFEYSQALKNQINNNYKIKYYKGLGTSSDQEIKDTFGLKIVGFLYDDLANLAINKAFHQKLSNDRKTWLNDYDPFNYNVPNEFYKLSEYINQDLIKFSIEDCKRSIPNIFDGLKISQRKILYSVFKKHLHYNTKSMKVAQLAGYCAEVSNYHHGEQCLYETITKMSQNFPGSNNIPYLEKDGQFGSRTYLGKDAANARYIFTKCTKLTRLLFPEIDDKLLNYLYDDGDLVEPEYYCPIIPTILANGCIAGIGTGWSCSVPNFNVLDLIKHIKLWLNHEFQSLDILPFYNGFKGSIEKLEDNKFMSYGILEEKKIKNKKIFEITEIPIQMSTNKLKEDLETLCENKKLKSIKNYSTPDSVHFIIEPTDDFKPTIDNLKLKSSITSTNMVLFINESKLKKFNTIQEIFELFCQKRLELYFQRKQYLENELKLQILILSNKFKFIDAIIQDTLDIKKKSEDEIQSILINFPFDKDPRNNNYDYLLNIAMKELSEEKVIDLQEKVNKKEFELNELLNTTESQLWLKDLELLEQEYIKLYH